MKTLVALLSALALAGCSSGSGPGGSCALVKKTELPVTFQRNTPVVDVKLNGEAVRFMLDTGAQVTVIKELAYDRLKLATDPLQSHVMTGMGGMSGHRDARVSSLELGSAVWYDKNIAVVAMPELAGVQIDGLLGSDLLQDFDLDLDMPHSRIALYQARDCAGSQPDWAGPAETLPRSSLGRALPPNMIEVELNGQAEHALIDTGAFYTTIDRDRAQALGVTEAMLSKDRQGKVQGVGATTASVALHSFSSLKIGSETIANPRLLVGPLPGAVGNRTTQMLLGEDYLRRHRVWLSYDGYSVQVETTSH